MSQTANRVIKNTGYLYAKMAITMFVSLYTTRLILNSLGTSDFGIYNIVGGAIAMLGFLSATMAGATQRFMSFTEGQGNIEKKKSIFNISLTIHFFTALVVGILLVVAGFVFFNGILNIPSTRIEAAEVVYCSLIISTMFTIMSVPYDAVLNSHENMLYYSIVGIVESILKLIVAFVCVYTSSDKLIIYGMLMACIPFVTLTVMRIYCHRNYNECIIKPRTYWDKHTFREMLGFAGWNMGGTMVIMFSSYGQGIILNNFFGTILNAAQGIASQLNGQMQALSSNVLKALNPLLGKSAGAGDSALLIKSTCLGAKYSTMIYLLFALPMFVECPYILKLWLKNIPEWCLIFVRLQIIKSFIEMQFGTLPGCISATGKIKRYTICSTISNFFQLPFIYLAFKLGLPPYYIYIVSIIFGNLIVYAFAFYFVRQYVGMKISNYLVRVTCPLVVTALINYLLLFFIKEMVEINTLWRLVTFLLVSVIIYICSFCIVVLFSEERVIFESIFRSLKRKYGKTIRLHR